MTSSDRPSYHRGPQTTAAMTSMATGDAVSSDHKRIPEKGPGTTPVEYKGFFDREGPFRKEMGNGSLT